MTAQEIVRCLNERDITCYRIAKDLGFSKPTISSWRDGEKSPTPRNLKALREYYDNH